MRTPHNARLTGIWMSMFIACMTHAEGVVSNAPAKNGFRIDINDLPSESIPFICVAPRLASSAPSDTARGFQSTTNAVRCMANEQFRHNELFPFLDPSETVLAGPEPIRTASPSLKGFSPPRYQPTSVTNVMYRHEACVIRPTPVRPSDSNLPLSGTERLRVILGASEYAHVFNAVSGLCGDDKNVAFERGDGRTTLTFGNGLRIVVDDATGEIQTPSGLPSVSDVELADLTWARMESSGALVKWRSRFWEADGIGGPSRRLSEIRLDEVFRVSDKAFVAWRLLADPPLNGSQLVRLVFWIDIPSRSIISEGSEINLRRPPTPESGTELLKEL